MKIRVLVIDGAVVSRRFIAKALAGTRDIEAIGFAATGAIGEKKVTQLQPDVVLLDVLKDGEGLETLTRLRARFPDLPIIMFSAMTVRGAEITLEALTLGANDYAAKPKTQDAAAEAALEAKLYPKIRALALQATCFTADIPKAPTPTRRAPSGPAELLLIGASTGGPAALAQLLPQLPSSLRVPVVIVQHMPPSFTRSLATRLDSKCKLAVSEATDGAPLKAGHVCVAPGDRHLELRHSRTGYSVKLSDAPPENSCRPSVDVMFRSAAYAAKGRALAVVLTGMGKDGLLGAQRLYQAGATILAQDEKTSVVWGMPGYISKAKIAKAVLPLGELPQAILRELNQTVATVSAVAATRASQW